MEWDMKTPWDLENMGMVSSKNDSHVGGVQEHGKETDHNTGSVIEPFSRKEEKVQADCFVDLQLGRLGDFGDGFHRRDPTETRVSAMGLPGSSRRSRAVNNSNQAVFCLVEGCNSDFSSCKDYHKKHKVCDVHSKTPKVIVDGREQRFCQQCSRFHLLAEFDEGKRSCRTRLDGHNKRRRKQQPEFLPGNSGNLFANFQGTGFSSYINAQTFPTTVQDPYWTGVVKAGEDGTRGHRPPLPLLSPVPRSYNGGKSFPFLQSNESGSSSQILADGLSRVLNSSDCALSLLSSPSQPPGINLGHIAHVDRIPIAQPLVQGTQYNYNCPARFSPEVAGYSQGSNSVSSSGFSCSEMDGEHVSTVLVSDNSDADIHLQGILHVANVGNSQSEPTQTLPFSWH